MPPCAPWPQFWKAIIPGCSPQLVREAGLYADRLSVNIELPTEDSLRLLAPDKRREDILGPMAEIRRLEDEREERGVRGHTASSGALLKAGQTTQLIVGATPERDLEILQMAERDAQAVRDRAAADAARMVSESEVMRQAREAAQALVANAESEATAIRNGANQYAFAVLHDLSEVVGQMSQTIENGKRKLAERTGAPVNEEP